MAIDKRNVSEAMWGYVERNAGADTLKLMLKSEPDLPFDKRFAVMQIECRKKAKNKIPQLLQRRDFLFPKAISAEQCTHQWVAEFHASLFGATDRVLDMTMGLGVDSYYISQRVASLKAIELDEDIAAAGAHNYDFTVLNADSVEWLKSTDEHFDAIFIDPARRGDGGARLYGLADCAPDVLSLLPVIKQHAHRLYIKASPMVDVTQSMRDLAPHLTDVWAVSVKNECKELLFLSDFGKEQAEVTLHAINYESGNTSQQFSVQASALSEIGNYGCPETGQYLYEPNASVMKIGAYSALCSGFALKQVAKNSHLYFSDALVADFPGRKFVIEGIVPFAGKEIKAVAKQYKQMNVATRNFRLSADELKKRLKVRDGGDRYLFATTFADGTQVLLITRKA
ncbi:MAG: SAM-dependent methyltransferase [Bacteroidales bacterium]|nr:SAM-dependent methyltransferase [Bacteroidales bacterium]